MKSFITPGEKVEIFEFIHIGEYKNDASNRSPISLNGLLSLFSSNTTQPFNSNHGKETGLHVEKEREIILPPLVSATFNTVTGEALNLSFIIINNYTEKITADDISIKQNFTIGTDGRHQLNYYISFKRTQKTTHNIFRADMITLESIPIVNCNSEILVSPNDIDDVMGVLVNTNPKASRGTVTTVKKTH